jgi:hypothetical protein
MRPIVQTEGDVRRSRLGAVGMVLGLAVAAPIFAQTSAAPPVPAIEGHWVRADPAGSGSFGGLTSQFAPAQLTPEAAAANRAGRAGGVGRGGVGAGPGRGGAAPAGGRPNPVGVPYIVVEQPCANNAGRGNGALMVNPDSGGIHIIEHKDEVVLAGERGGVRHVYMDGRPHPNLQGWTPTPAGHSVGRYDGNALIVDTIGFTPGAVVAGGQRTAETRLTERFEVSPDGATMTITYTWQDPKIYQKPHTYSYVFDRLPPNSYAFEDWCDASDPIEKQSIVPPPQQR